MNGESETEGRALMTFLAGLASALGALADHPVSSTAPPEVGDALDDAVRGLQHAERAVDQALNAEPQASDPWTRCLPKILAEVTFSLQGLVTLLSTWFTSWWTRRLEELDRGDQAEPEHAVDVEVGHGAD